MAAGAIWDAATACSGAASGSGDRFACGGAESGRFHSGSLGKRGAEASGTGTAEGGTDTNRAGTRQTVGAAAGATGAEENGAEEKEVAEGCPARLLPTRGAGPTPNSCCVTAKNSGWRRLSRRVLKVDMAPPFWVTSFEMGWGAGGVWIRYSAAGRPDRSVPVFLWQRRHRWRPGLGRSI